MISLNQDQGYIDLILIPGNKRKHQKLSMLEITGKINIIMLP